MTKVKKAIIPAAGLGTRFLPATKTVPKEMLTIVDAPIIFYVVEEAVRDAPIARSLGQGLHTPLRSAPRLGEVDCEGRGHGRWH